MGCVSSVFRKMNIGSRKSKRHTDDDDITFAVPKSKRVKVVAPSSTGCFEAASNTGPSASGPSNAVSTRSSVHHINHVPTSRLAKPIASKVETDTSEESDVEETLTWDEVQVLASIQTVPYALASSFVKLLSEGCTLPFIARYRKGHVNNLLPSQ